MILLHCELCGKEGSLEEQEYSGKRLRLKCPYCSGDFVFQVPAGASDGTVAGMPPSAPVVTLPPPPVEAPPAPAPPREAAAPVAEVAPVAAQPAPAAEVDEALVHEARRISRLIISEIKLYNQDKIAKARSKREVLDILKNDLIKGKQHYNTRIASKLPVSPDYFMETVKEILLAGKS